MQQVLVLNASYEPLNVTTVRRAHVLVFKGKAEVIEELEQPLRSATGSFIRPHVIRLVTYVRVPRAIQRKISRRALFARDGWRCVYCGTSGGRLTLDHVVPRSRGGVRSSMPACSSVRSPLRRLHGAQAVTTFSQIDSPPFERGTTWSRVRRPPEVPQYTQRQPSRANSARREIFR